MLEEQRHPGVVWLTFDRPDKLNAFTADGYTDLAAALDRLDADAAVRVVVLTGNGRAFTAGGDLSLIAPTLTDDERHRADVAFTSAVGALARFAKPLLAAVNGLAVGFGCTALLYCDVVVVAETARLRMPFTALGIVPEAGTTALLPARTRWPDATWALLSSEWIDAVSAVTMGLALRVVRDDTLASTVAGHAATLAALDPAAVAATKRLLSEGVMAATREAAEREAAAMRALLGAGPVRSGSSPR